MRKKYLLNVFRLTVLFVLLQLPSILTAQCSSVTPTFTLDLTGSPNATSVTPSSSRNGTCCGGTDPCTKIVVLLHPKAMALRLVPTGADPGGALNYEINCNGQQIPGGTPICLSGTGPQTLTICKVGNNPNSYSVTSVPQPSLPDSVYVRDGCTQTLVATGFSVSTIQWTAINSGTNTTLFNSYLSCTAACATVVVTPTGTVPVPYVDYMVGGFGQAPCGTNYYQDTVRVYFYNNLAAPMSPTTICFGSVSAVLSPTPTGGKPAYTYTWSTGSNSPSITVGAGTYTLRLSDQTGCPPITSTVTVNNFTLPIAANTGPDRALCKNSPNVVLNGSITSASGGTWSASSGTFLPSSSALNATYIPSGTALSNGSVQIILGTTGNAGCQPDEDTLLVTFQNQPSITVGPSQTVCANNSLSTHSVSISGYTASPIWSAAGGGTLSSPTSTITTFAPTSAQISAGSASVIVTTTNNGACPGASATTIVYITPAPVVNAGPDQNICSNGSALVSGSVTMAAFTGSWSTTGNGSFANASSLSTSYTPGSTDISTGTVALVLSSTGNGNCLVVHDTLKLTVSGLPTVTAVSPTAICTTPGSVSLSGTIAGVASTGTWSSSGTGSFFNNMSLQTTYQLSSADQAAGTLTFVITSTNNGPCPAVSSSITLSVVPLPTVSAGANQAICSTQATISLGAGQPTINSGSSTGMWSTAGSGTLSGASVYQTGTYAFSPADVSSGAVIFTLTSTNNGICPASSDTVKVTLTAGPQVSAGANQPVCSSSGFISLTGTVNGGLGNSGSWSASGPGAFNPGPGSLNTMYSITNADLLNAFVIFTLTSTNNGPCGAQSDTVRISVTRPATVSAGSNQLICSTQPTISLNGNVSSTFNTGAWTASGGGVFSPTNNPVSTYAVTQNDINAGAVTFTLQSTNNGPCATTSNTMLVQITRQATVNASSSQSVCSTNPSVAINGTVSGGTTTGAWGSSGTGSFMPANNVLNANYVISNGDISNGAVTLTLSSTNNSPCAVATSTLRVHIQTPAQVNTGTYQPVCSANGGIQLNGSVIGGQQTGIWTATGTGTFSPANTNLSGTYLMSATDAMSGSVTLTLTSTNNAACTAVSQPVTIPIVQQVTVVATDNFSACSNQQSIPLNGTLTGNSSGTTWSTGGSGTITNTGALLTSYNIATSDISAGKVMFYLTASANGPCPAAHDSTLMEITRRPVVNLRSDTSICANQNPLELTSQINNGSGSVLWVSSGSGSFSPSNFLQNVSYHLSQADILAGEVHLSLNSVDNGACGNVSATLKVEIRPSPQADFSPSTLTVTLPGAPVVFTNESGGATSYSWQISDGTRENTINLTRDFTAIGYYTVSLVVENQYACLDSIEKVITVISSVKFPTAFSPNGDKLNDVFRPYTDGVVKYDLMIFNRWGELIFKSNDLRHGWDGTFNGKACQQDAYVWKAHMTFFDGRTYDGTGSITLLK